MPKKGYKQTEEHRKKISQSNRGKHNYWLGKFHSEEHKRKVSEAGKRRYLLGYTSIETRKKLSESNKGEKSYRWKNGVTPENRRIRHSIEFRLWREAVFARDNWTCQKCMRRGSIILHPHHIKSFAKYPELRFAIENGITLCIKCHNLIHKSQDPQL